MLIKLQSGNSNGGGYSQDNFSDPSRFGGGAFGGGGIGSNNRNGGQMTNFGGGFGSSEHFNMMPSQPQHQS